MGCGSSTGNTGGGPAGDTESGDTAPADAQSTDTAPTDTAPTDTAPTDTAPTDTAPSDAGPIDADQSKDFGFVLRVPAEHTLTCTNPPPTGPPTMKASDMDWICTFAYKGQSGHFYVQSTPDACKGMGMSSLATFAAVGAWMSVPAGMSVAAGVYPLAGAQYDWGGNHHNDSLGFDWQGQHFEAYHSSFGLGWRKCQPMDCLRVTSGPGGDVLEDGCTAARTLPIWCAQVEATGGYGSLSDGFKKCLGDPNP